MCIQVAWAQPFKETLGSHLTSRWRTGSLAEPQTVTLPAAQLTSRCDILLQEKPSRDLTSHVRVTPWPLEHYIPHCTPASHPMASLTTVHTHLIWVKTCIIFERFRKMMRTWSCVLTEIMLYNFINWKGIFKTSFWLFFFFFFSWLRLKSVT